MERGRPESGVPQSSLASAMTWPGKGTNTGEEAPVPRADTYRQKPTSFMTISSHSSLWSRNWVELSVDCH